MFPVWWPPFTESPFAYNEVLLHYSLMSSIKSESITLPSWLIQAHAPDQDPLSTYGYPLARESLQIVASLCWELAFPVVISTIYIWLSIPDFAFWSYRIFCYFSFITACFVLQYSIYRTYWGQKARHSRRNPKKVRRDRRGCIHNHLKILLFFSKCEIRAKGLRPHLRVHRFGTPNALRNATSTKAPFPRLVE